MKDYLVTYLEKDLLPRITAYKTPTEPQRTIKSLCEKKAVNGSLDDEDMTLLELHVKAERQAEKLHKARQKALSVEKKKKDAERKHKTRMKIILGGLIEKHIKNEPDLARIVSKLVLSMDSSTKDKELLISHLRAFNVNFDVASDDNGDDGDDVTSDDGDDVASDDNGDDVASDDNGDDFGDVDFGDVYNDINDSVVGCVVNDDVTSDDDVNDTVKTNIPTLPKITNH